MGSRRGRPRSVERYLNPGERIVLETRQHPFAVATAVLRAAATLAALLLVLWGVEGWTALPDDAVRIVAFVDVVGLLLVLLRLAWTILQWELEQLVITTEKVLYVSGVITRNIASTPLVKVSDLVVRQSILGRALDYGSLVVDDSGGAGDALHGLTFLPDPVELYVTINDSGRRERALEGGGNLGARPGDDPSGATDDWPDDPAATTVIRRDP